MVTVPLLASWFLGTRKLKWMHNAMGLLWALWQSFFCGTKPKVVERGSTNIFLAVFKSYIQLRDEDTDWKQSYNTNSNYQKLVWLSDHEIKQSWRRSILLKIKLTMMKELICWAHIKTLNFYLFMCIPNKIASKTYGKQRFTKLIGE